MYHSKLVSVLLLLSAALCLCTGAAIYPKTLSTQKGSSSDVALSALQSQDQSGSQDSWNKYVEFYGSSSAYQGVFTFDASTIDASSVGAYSLVVNFKGPASSDQLWTFEFLDASSGQWIEAGDNSDAKSWKWTSLTFCGTTEFSSLVSNGEVQVRMTSAVGDDCDVDYLAIETTDGSSANQGSTPTNAPPATAAPTHAAQPTSAPATSKPTNTKAPTSAATPKPTNTKAPKATKAPTPAATSKPTATKPPTSAPATQKPASTSTTGKTSTSTSGSTSTTGTTVPGGRICPTGQVWAPSPSTTWEWQLTGTIDQSYDVQMYDIDLFDNTADTIASLHAAGRAVICYFSTQYENWRPDASSFTAAVIGTGLDGWPGENYVDIRSTVVRTIMQSRLDLALSKGCDGVEPDNVDEYENDNGFGITAADQLNFNQFIATEAHKRGLSVGLKNDLDQVKSLEPYFDWALDEQCNQYSECSDLTPFVTAGKAVFGVEYSGSAAKFCPTMVTDKFSWLLKDLDLDSKVTFCCTYASGGCAAKAPHTCYNPTTSKRSIEVEEEAAIVDEVVAEVADPAYQEEFDSAAATTALPIVAVALVSAVVLLL